VRARKGILGNVENLKKSRQLKLKKMRKIYCSFMLFASTTGIAQTTDPSPYCAFDTQKHYNMWEYLKINGVSKNFGPVGSFSNENTYMYFDNFSFPEVSPGDVLNLELKAYSVNDLEPMYFAFYIDFNNNNVFDEDENFVNNVNTINAALPSFNQPAVVITKNIVLPSNLSNGYYRMRLVRNTHDSGGNPYVYDNNELSGPCAAPIAMNYGCGYDFDLVVNNNNASVGDNKVDFSTSISTMVTDKISIFHEYPNPEEIQVTILTMDGKQIIHRYLENQIPLDFLDPGMYLFKLNNKTGKQIFIQKFYKL
jgi:hypothetical protein